MSPRDSRRDVRKARGQRLESLFADPWRKLLAFGLAVLLWMFLNSRIVREDSLDFRLMAVDVAASPAEHDEEARLTLAVRLPLQEWTVRGFLSHIENRQIEKVQLHFEGPRYLIDRLALQGARFEARPTEEDFAQEICTFDLGDVHSSDAELQPLLKRMEPRVVRVLIERNRRQDVLLKRQHVEELADHPEFRERLANAQVTFYPPTITLFGPGDSMDGVSPQTKLFEVDFTGEAGTSDEELMRPLKLLARHRMVGISVEGTPYATYRLPPQFKTFTLNLPVNLQIMGPRTASPEDFVLEPQVVTIQFEAAKALETELGVKQDTRERDAWAEQNLLLLVLLRPTPGQKEYVESPMLFCTNRSLKEGVDWKAEGLLPIKITRKAQ